MQKSYKDPRQDWRKLDVQGEVLYSESSHFSSKMYGKEFKNLQQENTVQTNSELAESGGKTTKDGVGEKKVALGCGIDNPISRVGEDDINQEDSFLVFSNMKNQLKGMQQVENFPEAHNLGRGREAERLVESDDPKPAKSLTVQSSPAGESEGLIETVLEQHNQGEAISFKLFKLHSFMPLYILNLSMFNFLLWKVTCHKVHWINHLQITALKAQSLLLRKSFKCPHFQPQITTLSCNLLKSRDEPPP